MYMFLFERIMFMHGYLKKTKNKSFQNKATKHILKMCPQEF